MNSLSELSRQLGMRYDESFQDWAIVNAAADRVNEFLQLYQSRTLGAQVETDLVELIVYSLDQKLTQEIIGREKWSKEDLMQNWRELVQILRDDQDRYDYLIRHILSGRASILEEEIEEYYPILLLFEQEFPNFVEE